MSENENVDLNELVKEMYDKIGSKEDFKVLSLGVDTIYFLDQRAFTIKISLEPLSYENEDEILKHAEMIKKWRNTPLFKEVDEK